MKDEDHEEVNFKETYCQNYCKKTKRKKTRKIKLNAKEEEETDYWRAFYCY